MAERIEYFFFVLISAVARRLSFRSAGRVGASLGSIVFRLTNFRKAITLDNLSHAFPDKSADEIRSIAHGAFKNYGIAVVESLWTYDKSPEVLKQTVRLENREVIDKAMAMGKGVLLVSAHYGSWELLPSAVRLHIGHPYEMVAQRQRNARINALIDVARSRFDNVTIPMGVSSRHVLKALQEKKIVLLLGDQSGPKEAIFVNFLGRPAATHRGAAAFAVKTGAPIVMGFLVCQPDGTYVMTFQEVSRDNMDGMTQEEAIIELTRRHVAILEEWIIKHPDHWLWMHKRWKHTEYFEKQQAEVQQ
jgi:Kdo2-lipid IVA lauroyltransferase/acyltransferase